MRAQPMPLIGGFYADESRPWSQQDICNWLPCAAEQNGTRSPILAKTPPGLSPLVEVGTRPVRGVYNCEGRLFAVLGTTLYQITTSDVAIPLGTIPGVGAVRFSHNQITGGNELVVVNGSAGWVYSTVTQALTRITDAGYPGAIDAVFIDGYVVQIEPARRFAFHSDLADATAYNTLDRFTSEVTPDLLVASAVSNNELILFSESSAEFFENTGATQQPFRSKRISMQKGCAGRHAVAAMDNTVFWLGDDGVFYALDGYSPRRISTRPLEQAIRGLNWAQAFAFVWEDAGHSVCYWTFPDGRTWGYDASQPPGFQWHRRESYGLNRWRLSCLTRWRNRWIGGDFQTGRLWELDWDYPLEGDQEFISEVTGPVIHDNQSRVKMPRLELVMDTGQPEVTARTFPVQPTGPSISGTAPDTYDGAAYSYSYATTAGDAAIAGVTVPVGTLPPGLTMSNAGVLSGTPTTEGSYSFTVRVTDTSGLRAEVEETVLVATAITGSFDVVTYVGTGATGWSLPSTLDLRSGGAAMTFARGSATTKNSAISPDGSDVLAIIGTATMGATGATFAGSANGNATGAALGAFVFRPCPGFCDVVKWVGDGTVSRSIPHGLGAVPGAVLVLKNSGPGYHVSAGAGKNVSWSSSAASVDTAIWGNTTPTAAAITVGGGANTNAATYYALVLGHDIADDGLIRCGTFTGNGSTAGPTVVLGWQPQAVLIKRDNNFDNSWVGYDTTRTPGFTGNDERGNFEGSPGGATFGDVITLTADGFQITTNDGDANGAGAVYYYIAIRGAGA